MEKKVSLEQLNNVAEIDIIYYKKVHVKHALRPLIQTSHHAYEIFMHYWDPGKMDLQEEFKVLYLSRANRVLYHFAVSRGGLNGTVLDPRLVLAAALKLASCSMVLAHNHPSGNLTPSRADQEMTQKMKQAASYFDIKVLDHLIISSEGYFSFADEGLL